MALALFQDMLDPCVCPLCPKPGDMKTHAFITSRFFWVRNLGMAEPGPLACGLSQGRKQDVSWDICLI